MASGSGYAHKTTDQLSLKEETTNPVPARSSRQIQSPKESKLEDHDNMPEILPSPASGPASANPVRPKKVQKKPRSPRSEVAVITPQWQSEKLINQWSRTTSAYWRKPWVICLVGAICFLGVLLSAGILQRPLASYIYSQGQAAYDIQVGGDKANSWQLDQPMDPHITPQSGPYAVLHTPSISVDFINQVLSTYHSPAAGKGQFLYDLGVQYGIDPAFALAFFMHESSFGTQGEAAKSLSLGNLRCIPNFRCQDNFAQFDTWEDGFKAWYQLIRNLYIAQWGLTTVDQIIPRYAPQADNNNEQGYIAALKHAIDTWHAGQIVVR